MTTEIQLIWEIQGANMSGLASDKNKLKLNLIGLAVNNSRKLAALAKFINRTHYQGGELQGGDIGEDAGDFAIAASTDNL